MLRASGAGGPHSPQFSHSRAEPWLAALNPHCTSGPLRLSSRPPQSRRPVLGSLTWTCKILWRWQMSKSYVSPSSIEILKWIKRVPDTCKQIIIIKLKNKCCLSYKTNHMCKGNYMLKLVSKTHTKHSYKKACLDPKGPEVNNGVPTTCRILLCWCVQVRRKKALRWLLCALTHSQQDNSLPWRKRFQLAIDKWGLRTTLGVWKRVLNLSSSCLDQILEGATWSLCFSKFTGDLLGVLECGKYSLNLLVRQLACHVNFSSRLHPPLPLCFPPSN